MYLHFPEAKRHDVLDVLNDGFTNGFIDIRSGTAPANADATATGTLLATLGLSTMGVPTAGVIVAGAITSGEAVADGTATWARIRSSGGATVCDADVSDMAGSAALRLVTTDIATGATVSVTSFALGFPGA